MAARPSIALLLAGAFLSLGASYRTPNFVVEAPTQQVAEQIGRAAEHYRREKAIQWIGQEMQPWGVPCPLRVTLTMNGPAGATSFQFDRGAILTQDMHIEGSLDRLLASVLPHEITHTVLAYYFRTPLPRWADEGGSVLSEDELERSRHDTMVRQILRTPGRMIPLRRLFSLREYPRDVMVLYAEGYSVTNFLVQSSNRSVFLAFVAEGMRGNWDSACRRYYRFQSVEELERAWIQSLRSPRGTELMAGNHTRPEGTLTSQRIVVRQTAPPLVPVLSAPQPIVRGQAPETESRPAPPQQPYPPFPGGDAYPSAQTMPPANGYPTQSPVRLGAPQFTPGAPQAPVGTPPNSSPIGYSP